MAKAIHSAVIKYALSYIRENCNRMFICSTQPTTATMASNTHMLASVSMTTANMSVSAAVSGAHLTVSTMLSNNVSVTGEGCHVVLCDCSAVVSKVLCCTTCTSQTLTAGNTVNVPQWSYTINDPT